MPFQHHYNRASVAVRRKADKNVTQIITAWQTNYQAIVQTFVVDSLLVTAIENNTNWVVFSTECCSIC